MAGRKSLPHEVPLWIDPAQEVFFVTLCCQERGRAQLTTDRVGPGVLNAVRFYQAQSEWWPHLFLLMPDHCHALLSVPAGGNGLLDVLSRWKRWTSRKHGIVWQRDFFEHRLRHNESRREKADYILNNPVRAGLVESWEEWPWVWMADGQA